MVRKLSALVEYRGVVWEICLGDWESCLGVLSGSAVWECCLGELSAHCRIKEHKCSLIAEREIGHSHRSRSVRV